MTTPTTTEKYVPNDSPFGDCFRQYTRIIDFRLRLDFLRQYDGMTLDEFASCARYQRSFPRFADDADLKAFAQDADDIVGEKGPF